MIKARSTYGRRASICEKFGWTIDYLTHRISWAYVVRMLIDLPHFEYSDKPQKTRLTAENAQNFAAMINNLN